MLTFLFGPAGWLLSRHPVDEVRSVNDLIRCRLTNQRLLRSSLRTPVEVVGWLGAMQSQDYPGAKWAIGLRAPVTGREVDRACDEGAIVRTHILRLTWHFVARDDIRWMLALSGPRVNAVSAHYYRKMELDERTFTRSRDVFERSLRDGAHKTRPELGAALRRAGIVASGTRLAFLTLRAELDAVICNGPRRGKELTYALFDERVPAAKPVDRDEALARLATRYFSSHGPATLKDYVWWSGLTVRDAKAGIDLAGAALSRDDVDGFTYWSAGGRAPKPPSSTIAHLLPNYDEYLIAHKDRHLVVSRLGRWRETHQRSVRPPHRRRWIVLPEAGRECWNDRFVAIECAAYAAESGDAGRH